MDDFNLPHVNRSTNTLKLGPCNPTPDRPAIELIFNLMDEFFPDPNCTRTNEKLPKHFGTDIYRYANSIHNIYVEKTIISDQDLVLCDFLSIIPNQNQPLFL